MKGTSEKTLEKVYKFKENCNFVLPEIDTTNVKKVLIFGNVEGIFGYPDDLDLYFNVNCAKRFNLFWELISKYDTIEKIDVVGPKSVGEYFNKIISYILKNYPRKNKYNIRKRYRIYTVKDNKEYFDFMDKIEKKNEKYDLVIMNPPYDRSLHLNFLKTAIAVSEIVASIQPVRWLEETTGKYKENSDYQKYEESISKHIKDLEIISSEDCKLLFNILFPGNLGIYVCDKSGGYDYNAISSNSIIDKIVDYIKDNLCDIEFNKKDGYRVRVPFIGSGKLYSSGYTGPQISYVPIKDFVYADGKYNGHWWYEYYAKNKYSKTTEEITSSIQFNSELEGHNFVKQFDTDFVRYVESLLITDVHISNKKILWMGNAVNPRTGKNGYLSEWTDEDFNEFFNLTTEEVSLYKEFMRDFKERREAWLKSKNKK